MKKILVLGSVLSLFASGHSAADSVTMNSGYTATGTILQTNNNDNVILLLQDYGTADYYLPIVKTVKIDSEDAAPMLPTTNRTPHWKHIVINLSKRPWAQNLKQIPATVIDKGILRNVPYVSFRCGDDYEVNIYGDLDKPAGFEVGVYRKLLTNNVAKDNCLKFVEALLSDSTDKGTLAKLKLEKDKVTRDGLAFEITPPTDEDAYLGWWVSVYDEKRLDLARASESELKQITVAKTSADDKPARTQESPGWTAAEMKLARPAQTYRPAYVPPAGGYTPRPQPLPTSSSGGYTPSQSSGGSVYVRDYTRKDGTYVEPHTRSAPHRR